MRTGSQDYGLFSDDDGKFIGVSLGHDYCAEHEWGHDDLKRNFGIPELSKKTLGIKSRSTTKCVDALVFREETYKKKKFAILFTGDVWRIREESEIEIPYGFENYKEDILWQQKYDAENPSDRREAKDPIKTAWDGRSFGIAVMGAENVEYLRLLYHALLNKNAALAYINRMPNNPFSHASLTVMIADRLPDSYKDRMYSADKEYQDRIDYEAKIGMTKLKEKTRGGLHDNLYGHAYGYYVACSAKWINYDDKVEREKEKKEKGTKYDIMYWVNYSDDDDTHGYYTVEEVREWLKGKKKLSEIRARNEKK